MKRLIPRRLELAVFAALALACAAIASLTLSVEAALLVMGVPIFVVAALMGMRRSGQWAAIARPAAGDTGPAPAPRP